jgi:hypothetical protein
MTAVTYGERANAIARLLPSIGRVVSRAGNARSRKGSFVVSTVYRPS